MAAPTPSVDLTGKNWEKYAKGKSKIRDEALEWPPGAPGSKFRVFTDHNLPAPKKYVGASASALATTATTTTMFSVITGGFIKCDEPACNEKEQPSISKLAASSSAQHAVLHVRAHHKPSTAASEVLLLLRFI